MLLLVSVAVATMWAMSALEVMIDDKDHFIIYDRTMSRSFDKQECQGHGPRRTAHMGSNWNLLNFAGTTWISLHFRRMCCRHC